ncbi:MAG: phenylalanine--tRNA ligase subunit beta [Chloroflexi bacterium]|nr:phenylalanine--tRNA ligase subunit beta [Chloroflexota bacterium]
MKAPLSWLREFVDLDPALPLKDLRHRLTMAGLEVEDVRVVGSDWRDVFVARIVDLQKHPKSETLWVATLDAGGRAATVVSGAPNLRVGAVVPWVVPGGRLPKMEIGERNLVGIASQGMLCSGDELDISTDRDGIYLLEDGAQPGARLEDVVGDVVLDVYITPNRPDCMSIVGIARELHALTGAAFHEPSMPELGGATPAASLISVRIEDPLGCPRFTATVVQGVHGGPSPLAIQRRLHYAGVRAISNVVDVTNYVMLELGQPLHAFDRARLEGGITVRRARPGETLRTLDGETRRLSDDMLVVCDDRGPQSLAGVMGGEDSEISTSTQDVVLEGASWDRASIRRAASAFNLGSEAARRFGRGVDPELAALAVARAASMTVQLAGGQHAAGLVDVFPGRDVNWTREITFDTARIDGLLGVRHDRDAMATTLERLGFGVQRPDERRFTVAVPSHRRFDVEHVADLAEEVGRILGYDSVPTNALSGTLPRPRPDGDAGFGDELRARRTLAAAGLQEIITYSLVDHDEPAKLDVGAAWPVPPSTLAGLPDTLIRVDNPLSSEQGALRGGLLGSVLTAVQSNLRHRDSVQVFELARTWRGALQPLPEERRLVAIALVGNVIGSAWQGEARPLDFFDVKGIVDALARSFRVDLAYVPTAHPTLHPGRGAEIRAGEQVLGVLGQVHPRVAERFGIDGPAPYVAELDFDALVAASRPLERVATPSRFPSADRDVALVLDEAVPHAAVESAILHAGQPLLVRASLFDVYRGEPVPPGKKSMAFALTYQASDRTLAEDEVAAAHTRVEDALRRAVGAEIRGRAA